MRSGGAMCLITFGDMFALPMICVSKYKVLNLVKYASAEFANQIWWFLIFVTKGNKMKIASRRKSSVTFVPRRNLFLINFNYSAWKLTNTILIKKCFPQNEHFFQNKVCARCLIKPIQMNQVCNKNLILR